MDLELPLTVDLKVIYAEAAVRGDTATGVTKKVKTETGAEVSTPCLLMKAIPSASIPALGLTSHACSSG